MKIFEDFKGFYECVCRLKLMSSTLQFYNFTKSTILLFYNSTIFTLFLCYKMVRFCIFLVRLWSQDDVVLVRGHSFLSPYTQLEVKVMGYGIFLEKYNGVWNFSGKKWWGMKFFHLYLMGYKFFSSHSLTLFFDGGGKEFI